MALTGISHIVLTVSDLATSKPWYETVLSWTSSFDNDSDEAAVSIGQLPDGTSLVLRQHKSKAAARFDETTAGLDHLSIASSERSDLNDLIARLESVGGVWSSISEEAWGHVLNFRDPDNIAIEVVAPVPAA